MKRVLAATAAALFFAASPSGASAETKCRLARYFELPVTIEGSAAFMDVKVNGVETRFQIDTGAFHSTITPDGAKRLKLTDGGGAFSISGVGGMEDAHVGIAKTFDFAGVPLKNLEFVVAGSRLGHGGLIGENLLGTFAEVEYDFGKGKIAFYKVTSCRDADLAYWANKDGSDDWIDISPPIGRYPRIVGTVMVNGKKLRAEFDSGAHATIMTQGAAARAGIRPDSPGVKAAQGAYGFGHSTRKTWIAPVASFDIGHEEIKNTEIEFGDIELDDVDMLLGIDFFLSHHMFVVHSQNRLYFTYNGGPVFRLDQPEEPGAAAPAATGGAPATAEARISGTGDPEDLDREGDALMARREYEAALSRFVRAAELDPKTASRWVKRAQAELALHRQALAVSDLDHAIELKPDDVPARMFRGALLLHSNHEKAQADFEAAAKAAPPGDDVRLRIAEAYVSEERWSEAIPHLDAWLSAHDRESNAPSILNERCWARAMAGKELDKALADCDAALRKGGRKAEVLDSRGLVNLRLGRFREALADYDGALKLKPKLAWSLYGRGLAKAKLGLASEGEADIAAAVALDLGLPARAAKIGLVQAEPAKPARPTQ